MPTDRLSSLSQSGPQHRISATALDPVTNSVTPNCNAGGPRASTGMKAHDLHVRKGAKSGLEGAATSGAGTVRVFFVAK
jgi:hypothetical protein